MTPREQLIEAIALSIANRPNPISLLGNAELTYKADAVAALQALSDLGALVLIPVKPGQSVANVVVLDEKHVLGTTQEERNEGVYVNVLEGEQS
jgi:hypothetical protein